jgi:hypothetical protein
VLGKEKDYCQKMAILSSFIEVGQLSFEMPQTPSNFGNNVVRPIVDFSLAESVKIWFLVL